VRAIEARPDCALAHNNLALLHIAAGNTRLAKERLEHALALEPGLACALSNLRKLEKLIRAGGKVRAPVSPPSARREGARAVVATSKAMASTPRKAHRGDKAGAAAKAPQRRPGAAAAAKPKGRAPAPKAAKGAAGEWPKAPQRQSATRMEEDVAMGAAGDELDGSEPVSGEEEGFEEGEGEEEEEPLEGEPGEEGGGEEGMEVEGEYDDQGEELEEAEGEGFEVEEDEMEGVEEEVIELDEDEELEGEDDDED
jgi:hypothetical protein